MVARSLAEAELGRLLEREITLFFVAGLLVNLGLLYAAERSVAATLRLFAPTFAAIVLWLAALAWIDLAIDPVNVIVLPMLLGIGIDHSVYLNAHARERGGLGPGYAYGMRSLLAVAGTTLAGFATLALSGYPALRGLGLSAMIGLGLGAAATVLLYPILGALGRQGDQGTDRRSGIDERLETSFPRTPNRGPGQARESTGDRLTGDGRLRPTDS